MIGCTTIITFYGREWFFHNSEKLRPQHQSRGRSATHKFILLVYSKHIQLLWNICSTLQLIRSRWSEKSWLVYLNINKVSYIYIYTDIDLIFIQWETIKVYSEILSIMKSILLKIFLNVKKKNVWLFSRLPPKSINKLQLRGSKTFLSEEWYTCLINCKPYIYH